jgi:fluoride exporter
VSALTWIGVAALGGAGAVLRFVVDGAVAARADGELPVGTLAVNLTGAFALGLVAGLALHGDALLLAGTATLGSFTTFSTWMLETERLAEEGDERLAGANVAVSLAGGLAAAGIGWLVGAAL